MTTTFEAIAFTSRIQAALYAEPGGLDAIEVDGRAYVIRKSQTERLKAEGVAFYYLGLHERPDGAEVLITIPVNQD